MMEHPLTSVILFCVSLPMIGGVGYFHYENRRLQNNLKELQEKKKKYEETTRGQRLRDEERKQLRKRLKKTRNELESIQVNTERVQEKVEKELDLSTSGKEKEKRQQQNRKLRERITQMTLENIRKKREERQRDRQNQQAERMKNWVSKRLENWDDQVEEAKSDFESDILKDLDLNEKQKNVAQDVFEQYLNSIKETMKKTMEKIEKGEVEPRSAMRKAYTSIQENRASQQERLRRANFSEDQYTTFWSRTRQKARQMLFSSD